jgi:tRNA(Ile)-lysidine synthase
MEAMILLDSLQAALVETCHLKPGARILLGLSGGPDSLCLLHALARMGWDVAAAHFDHSLRPESAEEAQMVAGIAANLGVACVIECGDVPAYARGKGLSIEEAARTLRYGFLFAQARRCGAQAVAVAHTADDQVETVLMHLLRGAGLAGLKGMSMRAVLPERDTDMPLVRPLLSTWRCEVEAYCQEAQLHPLQDPSNQNVAFFRNRLRHELIPYLESYNPNIRQGIWRSAQALAGDHDTLQALVETTWAQCLESTGQGFVILDLEFLRAQGEGMQRSLLRRAITVLRPALRDVGFDALRRAQGFVQHPSRSAQLDLLDGLTLSMEQDDLILCEEKAALPFPWPCLEPGYVAQLDVPGRVALPDGWELCAGWGVAGKIEGDPWQTSLSLEALRLPLEVRIAQPGERWQPLGMAVGSIKLSDFWINEGLPRRARAGWPLVCSGDQVAWLPGFRPAQFCRLVGKKQRVVLIRLVPPAGFENLAV